MAESRLEAARLEDGHWLLTVDTHVPETWVHRCIDLNEYLIARSGNQHVGFLRHSMFWGVIPFMDLIYVDPNSRRQGVGSKLFRAWELAMLDRGAGVLMTSSIADEPEALAWHERNGFKRSGELTFGSYQQKPEVFFTKSLLGTSDPSHPRSMGG